MLTELRFLTISCSALALIFIFQLLKNKVLTYSKEAKRIRTGGTAENYFFLTPTSPTCTYLTCLSEQKPIVFYQTKFGA
jgi:hypothetical protein